MKKLILAAAIVGMTSLAFGQQQQAASKNSKDSKCSAACMKSCGDKNCTKATCTHDGKTAKATTASTSTTAATSTKATAATTATK